MKLEVGKIIYHLNPVKNIVTRAELTMVNEDDVKVRLSGGEKELKLPRYSFGKFLFFSDADAFAPRETLALQNEYLSFGNPDLMDISRKMEERAVIKEHKSRLLGKLKDRYNFQGFHHYTDFSNFVEIMKLGELLSRVRALQKGIVQDSGHRGILKRTDHDIKCYVRFFYRPCTPMLYSNEGIKQDNYGPHMPIPVLLLFDEQIIFHENKRMEFLSGCGGSGQTMRTSSAEEAYDFNWDLTFGYFRGEQAKNCRNAEFLYRERISLEHLKRIVFRASPDYERAKLLFGDNSLFSVDPSQFTKSKVYSNKCDGINYLTSFKVFLNETVQFIYGTFRTDARNFRNELLIAYEDGQTEKVLPSLDYDLESEKHTLFYMLKASPRKVAYYLNGHLNGFWEEESA